MVGELESGLAIATAALCGAAVGVEREWSGHASGPSAHFGGVRTFTLLGGLAGASGQLAADGQQILAALITFGAAALVVTGYVAASRKEVDATTEMAAMVVLAAGLFAGLGHGALASAMTAIAILLLVEKRRLHAWVRLIGDEEIRAGARFAVMALVVLPILPKGPYGPLGGIRPRELWTFVLLFSGLSFLGTLVGRVVGGARGYTIAGALGGLISSTGVTLSFARQSAALPTVAASLATGVIAAAVVMIARVLFVSMLLSRPLGLATLPLLAGPVAVASALVLLGFRTGRDSSHDDIDLPSNPLALRQALQMAALLQVVLYLVYFARTGFGGIGVYVSAALVGMTDVDAIVLAVARQEVGAITPQVGAIAIAIAVLANTVFKLGLSIALGTGRFRPLAAGGLAAIALACVPPIAIALWR